MLIMAEQQVSNIPYKLLKSAPMIILKKVTKGFNCITQKRYMYDKYELASTTAKNITLHSAESYSHVSKVKVFPHSCSNRFPGKRKCLAYLLIKLQYLILYIFPKNWKVHYL